MTWFKSLPDTMSAWSLKKRFLFAFLAGGFCVPAMPPYCLWPLLGLGIPALYFLLSSTRSVKTAFFESWMFAFGYFGFGLYWIGNALLVDDNPFSWVWPLAIAGLPALLAMFYGVCGLALHLLVGNLRTWAGWSAFIVGIAFTEWLRGHVLTGYPWNMYAYTWYESLALSQSVALFGSYGLTFITLAWAMIPALWWCAIGQKKSRMSVAGALAMLALSLFLWGHARLASNPISLRSDVTLRIVQPNIPQKDKWNPDKTIDNLKQTLDYSRPDDSNGGATTLIIWPETAISERVLANRQVNNAVRTMLESYQKPAYLMTGILRHDVSETGEDRYYNSLATYNSAMDRVTVYDKSHLVPFGEYIPFQDYIPLKPFVDFSGFQKGKGPETQAIDSVAKFSPLVCYEVIFPGAVTQKGGERPDLLVNVTNDGWYGDTAGPRQHLAMARFRAIEEGLPIARSANTGISAVFDPLGRLIADVPLNIGKALNIAMPQAAAATLYARTGDLPCLFFVIFIIGIVFVLLRVQNRQN